MRVWTTYRFEKAGLFLRTAAQCIKKMYFGQPMTPAAHCLSYCNYREKIAGRTLAQRLLMSQQEA
jgi:hypothetical protein